MDTRRLRQLAGLKESANDKTMYNEHMKDIVKNIMLAWDKAKALGIDYETFIHEVGKQTEGAFQDLED